MFKKSNIPGDKTPKPETKDSGAKVEAVATDASVKAEKPAQPLAQQTNPPGAQQTKETVKS